DLHQLRMINPEGRRLLGLGAAWSPEESTATPILLDCFVSQLFSLVPASEMEWRPDGSVGARYFGIAHAHVNASERAESETIWMFWDRTQEKQIAAELEKSRRNQALAEIATVLAHEIRNPLGSLELFAGLLADTPSVGQEARQWVGHLQAGVRMLSATV